MDASYITAVASIVVATVAASSAYASQRSAAGATTKNTTVTSRTDMEKEAYERARAFDTETIKRQDTDIIELRVSNKTLQKDLESLKIVNQELRRQVRACVVRIALLERGYDSDRDDILMTKDSGEQDGRPHRRWYDKVNITEADIETALQDIARAEDDSEQPNV